MFYILAWLSREIEGAVFIRQCIPIQIPTRLELGGLGFLPYP